MNFVPILPYPPLISLALTLIPDFHPLCSRPPSSGLLPQQYKLVLILPLPPLKNIHLVISFLLLLCNLTSHLQSQSVALLLQFSPPTGFLPISSTETFLDQVSNDLFFIPELKSSILAAFSLVSQLLLIQSNTFLFLRSYLPWPSAICHPLAFL